MVVLVLGTGDTTNMPGSTRFALIPVTAVLKLLPADVVGSATLA